MIIILFPLSNSEFLPKRWVFDSEAPKAAPRAVPTATTVPADTAAVTDETPAAKQEKKEEVKPEPPHLTIEQLEKELETSDSEIRKKYVILESFHRRYEKKEIQLSKAVAARLQKEVEQLQNDFRQEAKSGKLDEDTTAMYLETSKELEELWARYATIAGKRLGEFVQYARRNMGEDIQEISDIVSSTVQSYNSLPLEEIINRLSTIVGKGFDLFSRLGVLKDYAMANVPGLKQASDVLGRAYKYGSDKFAAAAGAVAGAVKGEKKIEAKSEPETGFEEDTNWLKGIKNISITRDQSNAGFIKFTNKLKDSEVTLVVGLNGLTILNLENKPLQDHDDYILPKYLKQNYGFYDALKNSLHLDLPETQKLIFAILALQKSESTSKDRPINIAKMIASEIGSFNAEPRLRAWGKTIIQKLADSANPNTNEVVNIIKELVLKRKEGAPSASTNSNGNTPTPSHDGLTVSTTSHEKIIVPSKQQIQEAVNVYVQYLEERNDFYTDEEGRGISYRDRPEIIQEKDGWKIKSNGEETMLHLTDKGFELKCDRKTLTLPRTELGKAVFFAAQINRLIARRIARDIKVEFDKKREIVVQRRSWPSPDNTLLESSGPGVEYYADLAEILEERRQSKYLKTR